MMNSKLQSTAWATFVCIALWALTPATAWACDPVPEKYRDLKNPETLSERDVKTWAKQYKAKCARCHGEDGSGGGEEAKTQKVPPVAFTDKAFMAKCSDGQLYYQVFVGGESKSAMPGFGPESDQGWSESKVWRMVAFIRQFAQ